MNCPKCGNELEIFAREGKEIYVCPFCLCGLIPDEPSAKILKNFCTEEIMNRLISDLMDESFFENIKTALAAEENLACPKCKSYMQQYDFNKRIRFYVNRCISCGAVWLNSMQMPLVSIAFLENTPKDLKFKKSIDDLYKALANKKARKVRSIDEIIAPFIAITGLIPAIPTGDNVLTKTKPIATRYIIIFCCLVFILQMTSAFSSFSSSGQFGLSYLTSSFALIKERVFSGGEWYRLITYAFLHGDIYHILGNMLFFNIFGKSVENELGWKKYLSLFTAGAVFSGIFFMATTVKNDLPCIGASGAISAVIGGYLILFPWAKLRLNLVNPFTYQKLATTEVPSMYYILSWIIMNVFFGMLQSGGKTTGIAYWGHIGGFIAGIVFIEVYKNLKRG